MNKQTSRKIANKILDDISDRKGIGNELEQIDEDVMEEIRESWIKIMMKENKTLIKKIEKLLKEEQTHLELLNDRKEEHSTEEYSISLSYHTGRKSLVEQILKILKDE